MVWSWHGMERCGRCRGRGVLIGYIRGVLRGISAGAIEGAYQRV